MSEVVFIFLSHYLDDLIAFMALIFIVIVSKRTTETITKLRKEVLTGERKMIEAFRSCNEEALQAVQYLAQKEAKLRAKHEETVMFLNDENMRYIQDNVPGVKPPLTDD